MLRLFFYLELKIIFLWIYSRFLGILMKFEFVLVKFCYLFLNLGKLLIRKNVLSSGFYGFVVLV